MEIMLTCIASGLFALLSVIPGLYYRYYYINDKKKPQHLQQVLTAKRIWIPMTICHICIGAVIIGLTIYYRLSWDTALREQAVLHFLAVIASIDLSVKKIPNGLVAGLLSVWILFFAVDAIRAFDFSEIGALLLRSGLGLLTGGGILLICMLISRGGLGAGDVKLFAVLGLFYGMIGVLNVLFYTCLFTAVVCIVLLVARKLRFKDTVPMSPFILAAAVLYDIFS